MKKVLSLMFVFVVFLMSCQNSLLPCPDCGGGDGGTPPTNPPTHPPSCSPACGGSASGSWTTLNQYHIYPDFSFDVSCAANGSTISVLCSGMDVPNRFTIVTSTGVYVTSTIWLGNASFPGQWGQSIHNSGSASLSFTKATGATSYILKVEGQTAPNGSYSPSTDAWQATITCGAQ